MQHLSFLRLFFAWAACTIVSEAIPDDMTFIVISCFSMRSSIRHTSSAIVRILLLRKYAQTKIKRSNIYAFVKTHHHEFCVQLRLVLLQFGNDRCTHTQNITARIWISVWFGNRINCVESRTRNADISCAVCRSSALFPRTKWKIAIISIVECSDFPSDFGYWWLSLLLPLPNTDDISNCVRNIWSPKHSTNFLRHISQFQII